MADELQEEPDENFDSWDLPVDWRLQKEAKKATNLGASMGIRFPLFRSLQKPTTTKRCLVYGGKGNTGVPINLLGLGAADYAFRRSLDCLKFLPKNVAFCIERWYSDIVSLNVSLTNSNT